MTDERKRIDPAAAEASLGWLIGSTPGPWDDLSVSTYAEAFEELYDADALRAAVRKIASTWQEDVRPSLGVVLSAYRSEVERRQARQLPAATRTRIVPAREGLAIARQAYIEQRRSVGETPNVARFDRWIDDLGKAIER